MDANWYCHGVPRKKGGSEEVGFGDAAPHRRGLLPSQVGRRPWAKGERTRIIRSDIEAITGPALIWVEHRDVTGLVFKVELTADGKVAGFHVRPLVFRSEKEGAETVVYVDDDSTPPTAEHLTARRLRNLPVGEVCDTALTRVRQTLDAVLGSSASRTGWGQIVTDKRRPGRSGRPDFFYAQVAAEYVQLLDEPGAKPVKALAERNQLGESTVRNLLYEARTRRRGPLLTKAPPGRAGGELTQKAISLLRKGTE